ncbi:uncharacterized protein PADG_06166 [Paracoccidioides brasiliensis Pb18]|uniref:PH domain-containing protein n=1 Tax=Paracoccidioides brasiliensis (strain Pb18) TaxID=502780 RepID=C1GFY0_PARBD|nr:uncharacterized protein PADG_06166 [Paracoccidioides brasiliensis Pb18]EEH50087.1 hypothetical protein PADG_06166 [Paracoccidioides brasiliensis Pb18]
MQTMQTLQTVQTGTVEADVIGGSVLRSSTQKLLTFNANFKFTTSGQLLVQLHPHGVRDSSAEPKKSPNMSNPQGSNLPSPTQSGAGTDDGHFGLGPDSYTSQRLRHSSHKHLHITSRRTFIGPIPYSWLQPHRKTWYKKWLGLKNYSSRAVTFSVDTSSNRAKQRQLTSFLSVSNRVIQKQSFPQPEDVCDDEPVETTPVAPLDASQVAPVPIDQGQDHQEGQQQKNPTPRIDIENEQRASSDHKTTPSGQSGPIVRTSSTDHGNVEEYFTPHESLRETSGFRLLSPTDMRSRQSESSNANQIVLRRSEQVDDPVPSQGPSQPSEEASSPSTSESSPLDRTDSTQSLISHKQPTSAKLISRGSSRRLQAQLSHIDTVPTGVGDMNQCPSDHRMLSRIASGIFRFQHDGTTADTRQPMSFRKLRPREVLKDRRRRLSHARDGEIIRAERMLVRIDVTKLHSLPHDFSENNSIKIETRTFEKWREFLVVCRRRADEETPITLQLYKTRVIPQVQVSQVKKSSSHEIPLTFGFTKLNLFSSLDKSIVLWHPDEYGTVMYIIRTKSAAHSMEWYTFLRTTLGWERPTQLVVHVPDLDIAVLINNPFSRLENDRSHIGQDDDERSSALLKTVADEQEVAAGVIKTCMNTLSECPEWASLLKAWPGSEKMGLAWRRYDRLEWVHGANEERMYGTIAMQTSHELELQPKRHYPTSIKRTGEETTEEPSPVEGFLILLTSQKGRHQRLGKVYSRRLYFTSQNQYLCFCRPAKAIPAPPPRLSTIDGSNIPSASQLSKDTPIIYTIDPYPLENKSISWLLRGGQISRERHDAEAYAESKRNLENLERSEGYFDLCRVLEVRIGHQNHFPEESHINGGDVEFHDEARDTRQIDGPEHQQSQSNRSFDLVMSDGLIVNFRAYDMQTRNQWVERLSALVRYWTARTQDDIAIMKSVRRQNLKQLNITEGQESRVGQFAQSWEVSKAQASPELFNMCGVSGCRAVKMSGNLYCKIRRRSAFRDCSVILTEGQILTFQSHLRKLSGQEIPHTHQERQWALDLRDCYIYSGLITSSDLLYQNHTIDTNLPGQRASPRLYITDGWTSSDEDIATCFVVWYNARKTVFRSQEWQHKGNALARTKWKRVSALGVPGRSIVFKARSRAERDMWVLAIETEIDRLQQLEDMRIISKDQ